ncbi:MAG: AAA family ATPase [Deltaproteobacteria bacterium]|nr:AAA family ATPase [Deltaproteobacteria bacterium]
MMLSISIGNFKAFADTQRIPIRPLTLIYGANSSGKSSILHSLIFAHYALETGELDVHRSNLGGDAVDLGGFRQFVHRREVSRRLEWSAELDTAYFKGRLQELLAPVKKAMITVTIGISLDDQGRPLSGAKPEIIAYELFGDNNSLLRMSRRRDGSLKLDRLEHDNPIFREVIKAIVETSTTTETFRPSDYEGLEEAISEIVPELEASVEKFLPAGINKTDFFTPDAQPSLFPVSKGRRQEDLAAAVRFFIPRTINELIRGVSSYIESELLRLQYLGPLRSYPPRHLAFSQHHDPNWFAGGGYAWDVVRQDSKVREKVNEWLTSQNRLQTPYELTIRNLLTIDDLNRDFWDHLIDIEAQYTGIGKYEGMDYKGDLFGELVPSILDRLKDNQEELSDIQEVILIDRRSKTVVSHRDVGIGVSQVLPVLVGAYASHNKIIAIEQPEIHLHPAIQADLGDVFIQSALGENRNRFLIETHSEHLLLRIMRRMRETNAGKLPKGCLPVCPEDVMVLFVEPDGSRSIVREMPLNENGELVKAWPGGFFEEGLREIF